MSVLAEWTSIFLPRSRSFSGELDHAGVAGRELFAQSCPTVALQRRTPGWLRSHITIRPALSSEVLSTVTPAGSAELFATRV
jgi:hypothetical protein